MQKERKQRHIFKYLDWKKSENEIALFTMYAYADLKIPKEFSCIFDLKNPARMWTCKMTLTQSIWEGWYPIDYIEHGHKHLAIFKFEDKIPEIILELYEVKNKDINLPESYRTIGICQIKDYQKIKKYLITSEELRKKHGVNWVEFYNEEE